jgi:hypothetical protein
MPKLKISKAAGLKKIRFNQIVKDIVRVGPAESKWKLMSR